MKWLKDNRKKITIASLLLVVFALILVSLSLYNHKLVKKYDSKILPSTYINDLDCSNQSFETVKKKISDYEDVLLDEEIMLIADNKEFIYKLKDIGVRINIDETVNRLKEEQDKLSYGKKLIIANRKVVRELQPIYYFDDEILNNIMVSIKEQVNREKVDGYFDTSEGVRYVDGTKGYNLSVEESITTLKEVFAKDIKEALMLNLVGEETIPDMNESYKTIDTMTSSFVTTFMPNTYLRNINLNTALRYINGTIVEPGEIFSYCKLAGPFNKSGYVFYYEFVGNGVCQIATTTYNAALLGGLEIVKRYPHKKKSLYVAGGLDATVASYTGGWCVDMQFKNTYQYPIYVKAYSEGGRAHVEFWSSSLAKEGKEYKTESVQIGQRGYRSYLYTYKDGEFVDKKLIATTWYSED